MTALRNRDDIKKKLIDMMPVDMAWLVTGHGFWRTSPLPRFGIRSLKMSDGPHGLRLLESDQESEPYSVGGKATCFPPACTSACSWDRGLQLQIGRALALECQGKTDILLGPGINIKRSPLGGRNFEYYSEDPYLAGQLGAAWVEGLQSEGIGACLKHYAVNSQENYRMVTNSLVDYRALHEIYLRAFEHVVSKAGPWAVMASYNRINGVYASENSYLLSDLLRGKWKFNGVVISDWGAVNDRVAGIMAGLDLEMPGSGAYHVKKMVKAQKKDKLISEALTESCRRLLQLHDRCHGLEAESIRNYEEDHHYLAVRAAEQSMVLVKNDKGILPLKLKQKIAVIGDFAQTPRYQGHGSSRVNPTHVDTLLSALDELECAYTYARGFDQNSSEVSNELMEEALQAAGEADMAIVCIGLPDYAESEGFDRENMRLPTNQQHLLDRIWTQQPRLVAVYYGGSPVEFHWANRFQGILIAGLGGQGGGTAVARLLLGLANPSGKLAETWPLRLEDTPCGKWYPGNSEVCEYRESIYVGYRYYLSADLPVLWPFGFGLSYSSFEWYAIALDRDTLRGEEKLQVTCYLKNISQNAGAEVVQVYISALDSPVDRPLRELKAFAKVFLEPGETRMISFSIDWESLACFDALSGQWKAENGTYEISIGSSSQDIRLRTGFVYEQNDSGENKERISGVSVYDRIARGKMLPEDLKDGWLNINSADFARRLASHGKQLDKSAAAIKSGSGDINMNTLVNDLGSSKFARKIMLEIFSGLQASYGNPSPGTIAQRQLIASWEQMPLRAIALLGGKDMDLYRMEAIISMLNGHMVSGGAKFVARRWIDKIDEISREKKP